MKRNSIRTHLYSVQKFKMAEAVAEEYRSSLVDLNFNSKPHINMLTIIAEENVKYAPMIVDTILTHVKSVSNDKY